MSAGGSWRELVREKWAGSGRLAVATTEGAWDGEGLLGHCGGAASWLADNGFPLGQPVPALLDWSFASITLVVGGALAGHPVAPLGTRLTVEELAAAARTLGAPGLVATTEFASLAREVADRAGIPSFVLDVIPPPRPLPPAVPTSLVMVLHTSGTTGAPKPVPVVDDRLGARVRAYERTLGLRAGDLFFSPSPFHHTAGVGMVVTALGCGAGVALAGRFSPQAWRTAGELGVTHALLVPTMIDMLLGEGRLADTRPMVLQYGAAPIDPQLLREALAALPGTEFVQVFGQTEVSPVTALSHDDHLAALAGRPELLLSVGRPVPGVDLRIEGEGPDGVGEIVVRARHAFVRDSDGWHRTGDLGQVGADGYVILRGRCHDRIVRGGENVYPLEVERVLAAHPGVAEVAVVGVPDRRWGEVVKAVIVPADPSDPPDEASLRSFARERLAPFKVPAIIELRPDLPRNAAGKVLRRELAG